MTRFRGIVRIRLDAIIRCLVIDSIVCRDGQQSTSLLFKLIAI
jgi:hypothetical protein